MYYIIFNAVKLFTATFFFRNKLLLITYLLLLIATVVGQTTAVLFQTWNWNKAGDANDWSDLGHICNFRQYLYFSVLVSRASFLLLGFVSCTLWPLHLNLIFGNCGNSTFLIKDYSKSSDICVFTLSKKEQKWLQKYFLNSRIFGRRKIPNHSLNIIGNVISIWIKNAFSFKWPGFSLNRHLKYLCSFEQLYHSTWFNKKLIFTD